ncbi:MAG: TadE/TadG family type IV pilus assembly protein [Anaerolineae bacterium]
MPRSLRTRLKRWRDDERGTSMITAAVTLPLLIVVVLGIYYLGLFMYARWMFREATNEAAQYVSEQGRYWNINPEASGDLYPADWYDLEAHRIIASRLRDVLPYRREQISATLRVTVTEPAVATGAVDREVCVPGERDQGDYRPFEETGFMVEASWSVPFWHVTLPYDIVNAGRQLVFHERTIGHLQCPRWTVKSAVEDESRIYGAEGPALPHRSTPGPFPYRGPPTVTPLPTNTKLPTVTPTPGPSPTP